MNVETGGERLENELIITMDDNKTLTANFRIDPFYLDLQ